MPPPGPVSPTLHAPPCAQSLALVCRLVMLFELLVGFVLSFVMLLALGSAAFFVRVESCVEDSEPPQAARARMATDVAAATKRIFTETPKSDGLTVTT